MKRLNVLLLAAFCGLAVLPSSHAMEGNFDRSAEIEKYIAVLQSGTKGDIIVATQSIYWSGISDKHLADTLNQRLVDDFMVIPKQERRFLEPHFSWTTDEIYGVNLIKALASMGLPEYAATFGKIADAASTDRRVNQRVHHEARIAAGILESRAGMGTLMLSRANHVENGDQITSMLINLLKSDNRSFRDFALDKIQREKLRDPRLMDALADQVNDYVARSPVKDMDWKDAFVRRNIQYLGLSGYAKYRSTLQNVLNSGADDGAKKYAQTALMRLQ